MNPLFVLALQAVLAHRLRTFLSMVGISIGVSSVILLTSIGEGTRLYIVNQFSQFGTNLLAIAPGKAETLGIPGALGGTTQKLTIDDAEAIARLPRVDAVMPISFGTARVEAGNRGRSVFVYGVTPSAPIIWQWGLLDSIPQATIFVLQSLNLCTHCGVGDGQLLRELTIIAVPSGGWT